ncbi:hypothetical protein B0J13DRAFT_518407 [Dactylonectria estremocensis]|uniref:Uncharacterized protein n=1 Tax=Dactylonectria estremocensis TaxID=1079267 RepID=A0A9P9FKK8_9HYPO|nr:hypothetical protein B0J13DRAFT_518407 [Dactylonectria estremocensis]
MLSAEHHVLLWTLSVFSILVVILRHRFQAYLPSVITDSCLENTVYALTTYAMWKKKTGMWWLYIVTLGVLRVGSEEIATKLGFRGTMPRIDGFDEDGIRMLVAHGLVGFIVLGTVEPSMRRDVGILTMIHDASASLTKCYQRRDIKIYRMGMHAEYTMLRGRRQNPIWVSITGLLALAVMTSLIELASTWNLVNELTCLRFGSPRTLL